MPIYDTYTRAGFDPDKDMLQAPGAITTGVCQPYMVAVRSAFAMERPRLRLPWRPRRRLGPEDEY